jgi:hypothetical protein
MNIPQSCSVNDQSFCTSWMLPIAQILPSISWEHECTITSSRVISKSRIEFQFYDIIYASSVSYDWLDSGGIKSVAWIFWPTIPLHDMWHFVLHFAQSLTLVVKSNFLKIKCFCQNHIANDTTPCLFLDIGPFLASDTHSNICWLKELHPTWLYTLFHLI